jgi:hypothetical protein
MYSELINEIIKRYFEAIEFNVKNFKNLRILVCSVTPTAKSSVIKQNPQYPHVGSDEQRKEVTKYMNLKIKEYCEKFNYTFVDIHDKYCDVDGCLNYELSDGHVHIVNPLYIIEFIKNKIL